MIHSLSGGTIRDKILHTFVKADFGDGVPRWYLCDDLPVETGYKVTAAVGGKVCGGTAIRVDKWVSEETSPIPFKRAQSIISATPV